MSENTSVVQHYSDTLTVHKTYTRMVIEKDKAESFSFDELVEKTKADIDRLNVLLVEMNNCYDPSYYVVIELIEELNEICVDHENIATVNMQIVLIDAINEKVGIRGGGWVWE